MKKYLEKIRKPNKKLSMKNKILITLGIMIFGFALGVFQKWVDGGALDILPLFLQKIDIGNYFGRLAIWVLLGTVISVFSESALRAGINTLSFFLSMLAGYYIYCNFVLGFLPVSYMIMRIWIALISFFLAAICWYAKGDGIVSIMISAVIIGVLFSQAFLIIQGFYVTHFLEVVTWILGLIVLYRKPKEFVFEFGLSIFVAILYQMFIPYYG